jgi:hypothetical protein
MLKAWQKRIDARDSLLLADATRNELVNIGAHFPKCIHISRAANSIAQACRFDRVNILQTQLNMALHVGNAHSFFCRISLTCPAQKRERIGNYAEFAPPVARAFKTKLIAHGEIHFLVFYKPLVAAKSSLVQDGIVFSKAFL